MRVTVLPPWPMMIMALRLSFWATLSFGSNVASNQRVDGMPEVFIMLRIVEARLEPLEVDLPDPRPVLPGAFDEAVIERQRHDIEAEIGRALHVGVAAEDVGAGAGRCRRCRWPATAMQNARTLAVPTVCWVAPMHQISVAGFSVANILATRSSCAPGTPETRSTSSGVHFSTSLRTSSMP